MGSGGRARVRFARLALDLLVLRKMRNQKEALSYIADQNDGVLRIAEAKQALIKAGLIRGQPKYAYGHIHNMLKNDDGYDQVDPGVFLKRPQ